MTNIKSEKILVCGDVSGQFKALFKRVLNVNQKNGPFSMLICVGEFFGSNLDEWELYKNGEIKAPILTFILGPTSANSKQLYPDMGGCELAENIIYLGPSGIYPCSSGLKIAYISGTETNGSNSDITFNQDRIRALESATESCDVDIIISSQWPKAICNYTVIPEKVSEDSGSLLLTHLVYTLKPRYYFAGGEKVFYERVPYRNHKVLLEKARPVTRFISLADVGNPEKQKWLYAFTIVPSSHSNRLELCYQPGDVTEIPFTDEVILQAEKLMRKNESKNAGQFFYDIDSKTSDNENRKRKTYEGGDQRKSHKPASPCWFCLSSPDVEKHLVVSVGTYCYLALAKGGLVPFHLLILPIEHFQSTANLEQDCLTEIEKFKDNLNKMFDKRGQAAVYYERNFKSQHLQIQVVPLLKKTLSYIKDSFIDLGESFGVPINELPKHADISHLTKPGSPFFYAELPTGEKLFHKINKKFPIQFAREVLACPPLLNLPERVDWRECKLEMAEEISIRDQIREQFKPYDFTLEDDSDSDV